MNQWLKIALLSALPVVGSAHTISPFILPEVFDTSASQNVSFQSSLTLEKFFVPSINFKTSYLITDPKGQQIKINPAAELKRFNVAEFDLPSEGTYRIRTDNALGNSSKYALIDGRWLRIRPVRQQNANMQAPKPEQPKADAEKKPVTPPQPPRSVSADQVPANAQILEVKNKDRKSVV